MNFSQVNISSSILRAKTGSDPIQINIYGVVDNNSIAKELIKLYPDIIKEIKDVIINDNNIISKRNLGNPKLKRYSYDVTTSK